MGRKTKEESMYAFGDVCNSTRNQAVSHLRMMWRILMEDGTARIETNVWDGIKKRREVHTRRRELTVEELGRVVSGLQGEMKVLFAVGIYTGLRLGDCAMLEWGQVDLVRQFITLAPRKTIRKNGRTVTIPIHPVLMSVLQGVVTGKRVGYVMPGCAASYRHRSGDLSKKVMHLFKKAGIETRTQGQDGPRRRALVSFHSLRHTFVSMSANAGVPLAVVQSIVGHATAEMTRHYYHESQGALISAVAALPNVVQPNATAEKGETVSLRVKELCAALDALNEEERAFVLRHLQDAKKADSCAVVDEGAAASERMAPAKPVALLTYRAA